MLKRYTVLIPHQNRRTGEVTYTRSRSFGTVERARRFADTLPRVPRTRYERFPLRGEATILDRKTGHDVVSVDLTYIVPSVGELGYW